MRDTILMTGGTGFLGTELAAGLIRFSENKIYVLVRAADRAEAYHRLKGAWHHEAELYRLIGDRVFPVVGDFTRPGLGLGEEDRRALLDSVTLVLHVGAETNFQKSRRELMNTNYEGTRQTLAFAAEARRLRRFVYLSTAYVAGRRRGIVTEEEPPGNDFSCFYEESKAKAETLVRESGLPFSVCRPGMIVGDSATGWVRTFNTVYYLLKQMLLGRLRVLPVRAETPLNLVPGDAVAEAVIRVCRAEEASGRTFHLTCPKEAAPKAGELAAYVRAWAKQNLGEELPKPLFLPLPGLERAGLRYNRKESGRKKNALTNFLTLTPYFFGEQEFDRANTDRVCGPFEPRWRDYIDTLLTFACRKNFMRQDGLNVFERAQIRRESRRYPIRFYDITADGVAAADGPTVNERIDRAASALWRRGARKGDRIALTGVNSVAYMVLEQAIGFLGAVSVPIYYTTPAAETATLLKKSGAAWFFVGDRRMMEQIGTVETEARIVSFSVGEEIRHPSVMTWERFLAAADGPAGFSRGDAEDLATIRYTSGTTGEPKGVTFRFGQLAWMGEVLTGLLTWKDRNRSMRYLSFLPLSHVVEGILASYAPYYVLSKVDYYYLNDFGALTEALPKVRPTVFFSVPRFYEKLWDRATDNALGRAWLAAKEGPAKRAIAAVLRRAVLKKAGLDRCKQLIVGSAPVSEGLLKRFRALGIEIHNAYGQTEAPLITINRLGDNVIPTIGTPLPDTTVTAAADGELIVAGPQVTPGYDGLETENIRNGVLKTGDLGTIHENGHITLFGRKKDFIVTAYGKNISVPKIEERLKDIPGVAEAVLIGEKRPCCTALLWLEGDVPDLAEQVERVNADLSHPEQIRRYRVIDRPLSIQAGELTPNLKVKRGPVEARFAEEIEEMYR